MDRKWKFILIAAAAVLLVVIVLVSVFAPRSFRDILKRRVALDTLTSADVTYAKLSPSGLEQYTSSVTDEAELKSVYDALTNIKYTVGEPREAKGTEIYYCSVTFTSDGKHATVTIFHNSTLTISTTDFTHTYAIAGVSEMQPLWVLLSGK